MNKSVSVFLVVTSESISCSVLTLWCMQIDAGENTALDDLFMFFITSPDNNIFQKHLQYLVANCTGAPVQFISKYLMDEGCYTNFYF